jgi:hypothetical protein
MIKKESAIEGITNVVLLRILARPFTPPIYRPSACLGRRRCDCRPLSLVPGDARPHTGLPGRGEHFIAYAGTGLLYALGYWELRQRMLALICLAIASGAFEVLQNFVPGRSPSPVDALVSAYGAAFGLLLGATLTAVV